MKHFFVGLSVCALFCYSLFFPAQSIYATIHALTLWSQSVVPSLFPVMLLSRLLLGTGFLFYVLRPVAFFTRHLLPVSLYGTYALILGYLCGYPMGVKTIADLEENDLLSKEEGRFLAPVINQVSPGFIITYVCSVLLQDPDFTIPCLIILYGASLTYAMMTAFLGKKEQHLPPDIIFKQKSSSSMFSLLDHALEESIRQILKIGGYILLFTILSSAICTIPVFSESAKAVLSAILEISCGAYQITELSCSSYYKKMLLIVTLSFGGLCSAFQSSSFLQKTGISIKKYIKTKAMISLIALVYYMLYSNPIPW